MQAVNNKRLVFVFGSLELGGAERQALHLVRHLRNSGAEVHIWAFHDGAMNALCKHEGIQTKIIPVTWQSSFYSKFTALIAFSKIARNAKADALLPFTLTPNIFCAFVRGVPSVWGQRDEGVESFSPNLETWAIRLSNALVANSEGGADWLRKRHPRKEIAVIPNGVMLPQPQETRQQWRERWHIGPDTLVYSMVANLSAHKDHATLLRAWAIRQRENRGKAILMLAGRKDGATPAIEALVAELGIGGTVQMLGSITDIAGLLSASDVFVLSSRSEGLSNAVLEACAAGLPVLGSDIEGVQRAISRENLCHLSQPGNVEELARSMKHMDSSAELRRKLGAANAHMAAMQFSVERMCSRYTDILRSVLKR